MSKLLSKTQIKKAQIDFRAEMIKYLQIQVTRFNESKKIISKDNKIVDITLDVINEKGYAFSAFLGFSNIKGSSFADFEIQEKSITMNCDDLYFSIQKSTPIGGCPFNCLSPLEAIEKLFDDAIESMMKGEVFINDYHKRIDPDSTSNLNEGM